MLELLSESFRELERALIEEIVSKGRYKEVTADTVIIDTNNTILALPLILDGAVKVLKEDDDGDELVLYYLEKGDTCAMSLSCCMGQTKSKIKAVAETDVKLIMIPKVEMNIWLSKYRSWQEFVLKSYHNRFEEFVETIGTVAFLNMDERILKYLKNKATINHNHSIQVTHQQIADDLHTSRVVVSRLLKALEKKKMIELYRNQIKILDL